MIETTDVGEGLSAKQVPFCSSVNCSFYIPSVHVIFGVIQILSEISLHRSLSPVTFCLP